MEKTRTFYSIYANRPTSIAHPKTSKTRPIYTEQFDTNGHKKLVKTGETNVYDKIQSFKDETLIYNILDRFSAGDINAINKVKGNYGDFTEMPKTLMEAQNKLIQAERTFNELPTEVRAEFNHSYEQFIAAAANGKAEEKINKVVDKLNKSTIQAVQQLESVAGTTIEPTKVEEGIKYE